MGAIKGSLDLLIDKVRRVFGLVESGANEIDFYEDCSDEKIEFIAEFITANWKIMASVVDDRGGSFMCVLIPTIYTNSSFEGVDLEEKSFVNKLYESIRAQAQGLECFVDISNISMRAEDFVDKSHFSGSGNALLSERIISRAKRR